MIADRSEHGWATVAEYKEDELDNSDDEKRLFRAEVKAGRKIKQKNVKEAKKVGRSCKEALLKLAVGKPLPMLQGARAEWQRCHCF